MTIDKKISELDPTTSLQDADLLELVQNLTNKKITGLDLKKQIMGVYSEGSVLFADSLGKIDEDNDSLFWDDVNKRLWIGIKDKTKKLALGGKFYSHKDANKLISQKRFHLQTGENPK